MYYRNRGDLLIHEGKEKLGFGEYNLQEEKIMKNIFIEYPKCSTCKKAKKWLEENNIEFIDRNIIEDTPTVQELTEWINKSGQERKKWFNTSGLKYKELNLKDKLGSMSEKEKIELLASDGMLIKRPLLISDKGIFIGFQEEIWKKSLLAVRNRKYQNKSVK